MPPFSETRAIALIFLVCVSCFAQPTTSPSTQPAHQIVGHIESPRIRESSGLVASKKYPAVFWTHNDSGNPPSIFAITREGKLLAEFPVKAPNVDWEDIAMDEQGRLYLADIGNNSATRTQIQVYRIAEVDPNRQATLVIADRTWTLTYPAQPFDAESLFIMDGMGYIISKHRDTAPASIYRFDLIDSGPPVKLTKVVEMQLRTPVTSAAVSPDKKWLAVMTVLGPVIYQIDGDLTRASSPPEWNATFVDPGIESVCWVADGLIATTEGRQIIHFPWTPPTSNARPPAKSGN